jgi:hypothetical protein
VFGRERRKGESEGREREGVEVILHVEWPAAGCGCGRRDSSLRRHAAALLAGGSRQGAICTYPMPFDDFSADFKTSLKPILFAVLDCFKNQELAKHCAKILCNIV